MDPTMLKANGRYLYAGPQGAERVRYRYPTANHYVFTRDEGGDLRLSFPEVRHRIAEGE